MSSGKPLTPQQRAEIARRYDREWPSIIARDYDITRQTVVNIAKRERERVR